MSVVDGALPVRWFCDGVFGSAAFSKMRSDVRIVGVRGQTDRATARAAIRAAVVADLCAWSGLSADRIRIGGEPGEAPYALLAGDDASERHVWLAISHDGDVSVAAWRLDGQVGIDVMAVADVPDWEAVARDYLGPTCALELAALPAPARAHAFARAWSAREARLKCLGLALAEWDAALDARLSTCAGRPLDMPAGFVAALALP